jgi:glucose/arabinose dehydrogenase
VSGDGVSSREALLKNTLGRVRDVRVGPDGLVYLLTDGNPGQLLRLEPLS